MDNVEQKTWSVYKITNTINGKPYIGETTDVDRRILQHRKISHSNRPSLISLAIQKYGFENFTVEILQEGITTKEEALNIETKYIRQYGTLAKDKGGYNLRDKNYFLINKEKRRESLFRTPKPNQTSKYCGVKLVDNNFISSITVNKQSFKAYFKNEIEAAEAVDKAALYLLGNDTAINFPEKREEFLKENLKDFFKKFNVGKKITPVFCYNINGSFEGEFRTITECAKHYDISPSVVSTIIHNSELKDKSKTCQSCKNLTFLKEYQGPKIEELIIRQRIPVIVFDQDRNFIAEFNGHRAAADFLKIDKGTVANNCKIKRLSREGYYFRYKSECQRIINQEGTQTYEMLIFEEQNPPTYLVMFDSNKDFVDAFAYKKDAAEKFGIPFASIKTKLKTKTIYKGEYYFRIINDCKEIVLPDGSITYEMID